MKNIETPAAVAIDSVHIYQQVPMEDSNEPQHRCTYELVSASNCVFTRSQTPMKYYDDPANALIVGQNKGSLSSAEIETFLQSSNEAIGLPLSHLMSIGTTRENRSISALCIGLHCSQNNTTNMSQTLYTALHHSREPTGMMVLVYTIQYLVDELRRENEAILTLLSSHQLWFVPLVNPDGYAYNEQSQVWSESSNNVGQRKNRQPGCPTDQDRGVDLNRNYDVCFDIE